MKPDTSHLAQHDGLAHASTAPHDGRSCHRLQHLHLRSPVLGAAFGIGIGAYGIG